MVLRTAFAENISFCFRYQMHLAHQVVMPRASFPSYSLELTTQMKPLLDFGRFGKNARDP
jgi:hypothetical protein